MRSRHLAGRLAPALAFALALVARPDPASAQVREVVVGITPTCPYGIRACWAGAHEALGLIKGVESVARIPDAYNCTATVRIKPDTLPDPDRWALEFKASVDRLYTFRGIELTVDGTLEKLGEGLALRVPGASEPIALAPLAAKLQWNFKKGSARQPEPDERDALAQLRSKVAGTPPLKLQVTGPFRRAGPGYTLEVREFTPLGAD